MPDCQTEAEGRVVIGLGEALFDCLEDRVMLGGAPANLAVHAHQLLSPVGGRGVVVSRVGSDPLGRRLIDELRSRQVVASAVQVDRQPPTGSVRVSLDSSGEPSNELTEDVAWDHIAFDESLQQLAANCSAVCFGTLARCRKTTRATIHRFLDVANSAIRLLDVNRRQHSHAPELISSSHDAANVVKPHQDELKRIAEDAPVAVTRGGPGAVLYRQRHGTRPTRYRLTATWALLAWERGTRRPRVLVTFSSCVGRRIEFWSWPPAWEPLSLRNRSPRRGASLQANRRFNRHTSLI